MLYDTHTDALRQLHGLPSLDASLSHRAGGQRRQLRLGVVARDGQQRPRRRTATRDAWGAGGVEKGKKGEQQIGKKPGKLVICGSFVKFYGIEMVILGENPWKPWRIYAEITSFLVKPP